MSDTVTLSDDYQISIPQAVREAKRWEAGQRFVFLPKGDGVLLMPVPTFESLRGIAPRAKRTAHRDRDERV